ncbi:saccharopine dehydrogenase NADP-binding domain-containing protein [Zavarzinia sp. CC-PAN008]|uniref:saccharopine dehydrogenase NADP-binding domain-containing protein n=1 Tax=Zavarzinia sp. CC-PAN008 TaxID=3243332 RepID=UPI003F74856B
MGGARSILVVGGTGTVGAQACDLLRRRHPGLAIQVAGRRLAPAQALAAALGQATAVALDVTAEDPLAGLATLPAAILVAVNDSRDRLLRAATRRGIALVDIARWQSRVEDAERLLAAEGPRAPVVLASGWMAGVAALAVAAFRDPAAPAAQVDLDILFATADKAGPDSVAGFVEIHRPFTIWRDGAPVQVASLGQARTVTFGNGVAARCRLFSCPDQASLVRTGHARGVAARMGFDRAAPGAMLALLVRSGLWARLSPARRSALLHHPGPGAAHEFRLTIAGTAGTRRVRVHDPLGQTHMTAAGAVTQAERLLGLDGRLPVAAGTSYPEAAGDVAADIAALRAMGVGFEVT